MYDEGEDDDGDGFDDDGDDNDDGEDDDDNDDDDNDNDEEDETDQAEIEGCSSVNGEGEGDVHVSPGVVASRAVFNFFFKSFNII